MPIESVPRRLNTATGAAPSFAARAWVNFNGTGTVAIRASGNVSSITDSGVGDYTVNFTTAMPDVDYAAASMLGPIANGVSWIRETGTRTASAISVLMVANSVATDYPIVQLTIHR